MSIIKIMPCLDMKGGRVVKGVHFIDIKDAGDPVENAAFYQKEGADELAMLDIAATLENRKTRLEWIKAVAAVIDIPLTMGGGIGSLEDIELVLKAGADCISMNSAAVKNPELVRQAAKKFGSAKVTVAIDGKRNPKMPSGFEVVVSGGTEATGKDAVEWARQCQDLGAGVLLPTSMDGDGTKKGYDLALMKQITSRVNVPVIASGGVGNLQHLAEGVLEGGVDAVLAASIFHFGEYTVQEAKEYMAAQGIQMRL